MAALSLGPGVWDLDIITLGSDADDADAVEMTNQGSDMSMPLLVSEIGTATHHRYVFVASTQTSIEATLRRANAAGIHIIIAATRRPTC